MSKDSMQESFGLFQDTLSQSLCRPLVKHEPYMDWMLAVVLSLPHFFYAFIWFKPEWWRSTFGKQSVEVFSTLAYFGKALQFQSMALWIWTLRSEGLCFNRSAISLWQWLAFLLLVAAGQSLNVGIYKAIGVDGVYYGFKLGKKVPWVNGFPFNVVPHPQYVGSSMTVWGFCSVLVSQVPAGGPLQQSMILVAIYWTVLYAITGAMEQFF